MKVKIKNLYKRGRIYYFRMDVPRQFQDECGKCINISLGISDEIEAAREADKKRKYYRNKFKNKTPEEINEKNVREKAEDIGISQYLPIDKLKELHTMTLHEEIMKRLDFLVEIAKGKAQPLETVAISGALSPEKFTLERALERYVEITPEKWKLTEREYKKKYNPLNLTMRNFAKAVGKVDDFLGVTPSQVVQYRNQRVADVHAGKVCKSTYNKEVSWLGMIFDELAKVHAPEKISQNPFRKMSLKDDNGPGKRKPFTDKDLILIREKLATSPPNAEIVAIMTIAEHTGAGAKELVLLTPEQIVLNAEIPYIRIAPNEMRSKVKGGGSRHRDIPLIGPALEAAKRFPNGFRRYRKDNGGENLSTAANKWLPADVSTTFNGFRHRIQDSLRNTGCNDTLKNSICGHSSGMPMHYGLGYDLKTKKLALENAVAHSEENIEKAKKNIENPKQKGLSIANISNVI